MRPEEIAALGELAGDTARATADRAHDLHAGIAGRVFAGVGPPAVPVRFAHNLIARAAYAGAGELSRVLVRAGASAVSAAAPQDAGSLQESGVGRAILGALNGAVGDSMHRRGNALAFAMALRRDGRDVDPSEAALRRAYPDATPKLAVFVHGLGQTDDAWRLRASRHPPYGDRLRAELGYTPLFVRYNTGRHLSENGRDLAALLARVIAEWPTEVGQIALIGHSVGGLVACSACQYGAGTEWVEKVGHVFTLGSAHGGARLERLTSKAGAALAALPETRPLAKALSTRSAGIRDAGDPYRAPFLPSAEHCFISAGVSRRLGLLNDPEVYAQIRRRLADRPALPPPRSALPAPGAQRP